ncbi:MAG: DinB family protein [Salibacteraceae bacterium]
MIRKPEKVDPKIYYASFIDKVKEEDLIIALSNSLNETEELIKQVSNKEETFAYAPGKWNIKQLIQHMIDCERILAYRLLSLARNEKGKLLGFEENNYIEFDGTALLTLPSIFEDFKIARLSTISLVKSLPIKNLDFFGNANGIDCTARMMGWFISGHNIHHNQVLRDRYLSALKIDN